MPVLVHLHQESRRRIRRERGSARKCRRRRIAHHVRISIEVEADPLAERTSITAIQVGQVAELARRQESRHVGETSRALVTATAVASRNVSVSGCIHDDSGADRGLSQGRRIDQRIAGRAHLRYKRRASSGELLRG